MPAQDTFTSSGSSPQVGLVHLNLLDPAPTPIRSESAPTSTPMNDAQQGYVRMHESLYTTAGRNWDGKK